MTDRNLTLEDLSQLQCFDEKHIQNLLQKMGYSDSIFLEQGAKDLICEIGNEFLNQLIEQSYNLADQKKKPLTQEDINIILEKKFKLLNHQVQQFSEQQK